MYDTICDRLPINTLFKVVRLKSLYFDPRMRSLFSVLHYIFIYRSDFYEVHFDYADSLAH